jgi:hypothetical protein
MIKRTVRHFLPLMVLVFFSLSAFANNRKLIWKQAVKSTSIDLVERSYLFFEGAQYDISINYLPFYYEKLKLGSKNQPKCQLNITNEQFEPLNAAEQVIFDKSKSAQIVNSKQADLPFSQINVAEIKKEYFAFIKINPFRKNVQTGKWEKLISFDFTVTETVDITQKTVSPSNFVANSVLANGNWHKVGLTQDGIYKITYTQLQTLGVSVSGANPDNIKLYGNGGGLVPAKNSDPRKDDLQENAIYVFDGGTAGIFDSTDYILFYGQSQHRWYYDAAGCGQFKHVTHGYSDTTYYFITLDAGSAGKRISNQSSSTASVTNTVTSFNDYKFHESDATNLIKSGKEWYGEQFDVLNSYTFGFDFPNIDVSTPVNVKTDLIGRADVISNFLVSAGNGSSNINTNATNVNTYFAIYANPGSSCFNANVSTSNFPVTVTRTSPTNSSSYVGWLNYIEVTARRNLVMNGSQLFFRDVNSVGAGNVSQFVLSSATSAIQIWDVTDPATVKFQQSNFNVNTVDFTQLSDTLKEYVAFNGQSFLTPTLFDAVANQNLHGLSQADMIIICDPLFLSEASELATLHQTNDGLTVHVVTEQQVFNEFSSGARDATAIRDFLRMFYTRAQNFNELPHYALFYGDGSYDNKNRLANNTNFIVTYQSQNSLDPTRSYVADDYFAMMGINEGAYGPNDLDQIDIGIGRMPVKTKSESQSALNKIKKYVSQPGAVDYTNIVNCDENNCTPFGDWRHWICFIADDEDGGLHLNQAEAIADYVDSTYLYYNIDKIYLDAYNQVSTPGGNRYPDVVDAINKRVQKGALIINYTGHGGEVGLAHERIIEVSQINGWEGICNMPLWITATCEFSRWDDPVRTSAGEYVFLNPKGAGIGLMSTVRLVYAGPNFTLNYNFFRYALLDTIMGGRTPALGDLYMLTKSTLNPDENTRNFTLLCDPALKLSYPKYRVATTLVNTVPVNPSVPDTAKALSKVTVTGEVRDLNGNKLTNFNGIIFPTIFDKMANVSTRSNDGVNASPLIKFGLQKNILFKGKASVVNGDFTFTFVVPKDIAYQYGPGKISYYTHNGVEDGHGVYENIIIGGTDLTAPVDNTGPDVKLYMNDIKFVDGGITDENPYIFAIVSDSNGVNTVGNGIGHDITAVLDANTNEVLVLNDYYQSDLNNFKKGAVKYRLEDMSVGEHNVVLKVWDVYNNSSVVSTRFVVASSEKMAIDNVLNYPNPFTSKTQFFVESNQPFGELDIQIQVMTISGKLVKTINKKVKCEGYRTEGIEWNGQDEFGDQLAKGVYVYAIKVQSADGQVASKYEKLVILK